MTHAAHIALIEHELDGFHQSLVIYRQQMQAWYSRALDSVSHAADMPSLLGMDRVLRAGDSQRSVMLWLNALPPAEIAEAAAGFVVSLLIDLVIGAVLTTNGKPWKVMEYAQSIGASEGAPSRWIRIELSAKTIYGHPISEQEFRRLTK